jgi:hypothetical protein
MLGSFFACGAEEQEVKLQGHAGESCSSCSDSCLENIAASCECETCTAVGYDEEAGVLLDCIDGVWWTRKRCPGGVSVQCNAANRYRISWRDEAGNELPR